MAMVCVIEPTYTADSLRACKQMSGISLFVVSSRRADKELNMRQHTHAPGDCDGANLRSHRSTRPLATHSPAPATRAAGRAPFVAAETLEGRLLMAAADLDIAFGTGG